MEKYIEERMQKFYSHGEFRCGFAAVCDTEDDYESRWYFVNERTRNVFGLYFHTVHNFKNGVAKVYVTEKDFEFDRPSFINTKGEYVNEKNKN